ncbi:MAG: TonB-dependent receptor [Desulfobacter sp.]|nr:MAG: TonB-dependent receptor [Desulfobacter sp.]
MKHVRLLLCSIVISLALCAPAWAGTEADPSTDQGAVETDKSCELEGMTVIATKTPKAPLDSPASVSVISENEIDAFNSEHPFKPLFRTEGIYPRQYRGLADYWSRPMIRGNRALVMVDGLNWYDYGHYYNTGAIPMKDVEKIEVVRGPFSSLYGTLAQTGVINYETKIPYDMEAEASFTYGTDNTQFFSARIADRPFSPTDSENLSWADKTLGDKFFYSMSFKYRTTDGYETNPTVRSLTSPVVGPLDPATPIATNTATDIDPTNGDTRAIIGTQGENWYEDYGAFIKTGLELSEDSKLWYSFNISQFENGWSGGHSYLTDASGNAIGAGDVYIQNGGNYYEINQSATSFTGTTYQKESNVHTLHYDYSVPGQLDVTALVGYNGKETQEHSVSSAKTTVKDNDLLQADLSGTFHLMDNRFLLTLGTQGVKETATDTKYTLFNASDKDSWASADYETTGESLTWGTFIQAEYTPIESTTLYLGGRYDHWWGTDTEYTNNAGNHVTYEDMDDGQFSPKASVLFRLTDNGVLRGSYGKSFTAPSLYYRIANYEYVNGGEIYTCSPNPDLKATTNTSWEVGTEWEFLNKRLRAKATYFQNNLEDMITSQTTSYTNTSGVVVHESKRINAGEAEVDGIELGIEANLPWNLKGGIHYTHHWSEYTVISDASKLGKEVDEVPTDIFNFWLGYFTDVLDASVNLRYSDSVMRDERTAYADSGYKDYSDSFVVDSQVTYRPSKKLAFTLSVDNLFDEEYYEYYAAQGRTVMATVSVSL